MNNASLVVFAILFQNNMKVWGDVRLIIFATNYNRIPLLQLSSSGPTHDLRSK